jgi:hypothetical protein
MTRGGVKWLAIPDLTDSGTSAGGSEVLTTWTVTVDLPSGAALRKPRPASVAVRKARAAALALAAAQPSDPDAESSHARTNEDHGESRIEPRGMESSQGIAPRRADSPHRALGRVLATLRRARRIQEWIDAEPGRRAADAARKECVTPARVSQLLLLLKLAPEVIADLERADRPGKVPREVDLRQLAPLDRAEQRVRYFAAFGSVDSTPERPKARTERPGLQAHLARARGLHELLVSGRFASIAELGRYVGLSASRVGQLLNLADLHPEILAEIDRGDAVRISESALRRLAQQTDKMAQLEAWRQVVALTSTAC